MISNDRWLDEWMPVIDDLLVDQPVLELGGAGMDGTPLNLCPMDFV